MHADDGPVDDLFPEIMHEDVALQPLMRGILRRSTPASNAARHHDTGESVPSGEPTCLVSYHPVLDEGEKTYGCIIQNDRTNTGGSITSLQMDEWKTNTTCSETFTDI